MNKRHKLPYKLAQRMNDNPENEVDEIIQEQHRFLLNGLEPRNCISNLCADCGVPVSLMNSEGWEVFVDDGKQTQLICNRCMAMRDGIREKAKK